MNVMRTNQPMNKTVRILIARVRDQERTHHSCDRPACTEIGSRGSGIDCDLREHRHDSAGKIERHVPTGVHCVFYLGAECPQEYHVAQNVRPARVHEEGREDRDQVMAGNDISRNNRPSSYKLIAVCQFENESQHVQRDDDCGDDRESRGAPGFILEWDHDVLRSGSCMAFSLKGRIKPQVQASH